MRRQIGTGAVGEIDQGDGVFLVHAEEGAARRLVAGHVKLGRVPVDGGRRVAGCGIGIVGFDILDGHLRRGPVAIGVRAAEAGAAQTGTGPDEHDVAFVDPRQVRDFAVAQLDDARVFVGETVDDQHIHAVGLFQEGDLGARRRQGDHADTRQSGIDLKRRRRDVDRLVARRCVDDHLGGRLLLGQAETGHGRQDDCQGGAGISDFHGLPLNNVRAALL